MTIWRVLSKLLLRQASASQGCCGPVRMPWHGVVTPSALRTASQKTAQGKVETAAQAMRGQGLMRVLGAGRLEAAGGTRRRHQQRRDQPAIGRDGSQCGRQCRGAKPPHHGMQMSITFALRTSALCSGIGFEVAAEFATEIGDTGEKFGVDRHPLKLSGAFARDHHHRHSRRQHRPQFQPVALAHAALEPVAHHRVANPARDRDAQPRTLVLCAAQVRRARNVRLGMRAPRRWSWRNSPDLRSRSAAPNPAELELKTAGRRRSSRAAWEEWLWSGAGAPWRGGVSVCFFRPAWPCAP